MKSPFLSAIDGKTARWGRDMRNMPSAYGTSAHVGNEEYVNDPLPHAYPEVLDPLAAEWEEEEDDANHLYNDSREGGRDMDVRYDNDDEEEW